VQSSQYNFLREAQQKNPLCTRCLTSLELLSDLRKQTLIPGKTHQVLRQFADINGIEGVYELFLEGRDSVWLNDF